MVLRDPRSQVYNFDPYLEKIMAPEEFDYNALYEYITSSRDTVLVDMAKKCGAKFVGSTSSMTAVLSHFHFILSEWRHCNMSMLSAIYQSRPNNFTLISKAPAGIFLRYKGDGVYAIDADKMYDTDETVLSWLVQALNRAF
jgi:Mitochondrial protein Pet127